jgi:hypothetical protein
VAQQSDDTRQLIKAAWDKHLGAVDHNMHNVNMPDLGLSSAKTIAQGIAAELREELRPANATAVGNGAKNTESQDVHVTSVINKLQDSLEALIRRTSEASQPSRSVDRLVAVIESLSPEANALLQGIRSHHLSRSQYQKLESSELLGPAITELRKQGLIIPVRHDYNGRSVPCYYYPPGIRKLLSSAMALVPPVPEEIIRSVRSELKASGYPNHDEPSTEHGQDG